MAQGRSVWVQLFRNIINSVKPKKLWGNFVGRDHFGTEYYEIPKELESHKRSSRWFVPLSQNKFDQEIPPEWQAWLRHRRKIPPTEEEIQHNLLKMEQTIEKAKQIQPPKTVKKEEIRTPEKPFPVYEDYK